MLRLCVKIGDDNTTVTNSTIIKDMTKKSFGSLAREI